MPYSSPVMGQSTREVADALGITLVTLRMWILTGKIKPNVHKIGTRNYYDFAAEEVERVKALMVPKKRWKQGKPKLGG